MKSIPRIRTLPKEISDKIAAGEVVERPLSIVKELLENAIDAGATAIAVEIRNGGKTYIRLTDNGCGISPEDVALVFHRYATSKIATEKDLDAIRTLGFRGEALASIAAVSKIELITKTANLKTGTRVTVEGGLLAGVTEIGAEEGTTLIVSDLFYNTPARKKFLKSDQTESAMIIDYLSKMALAYPSIRLRLINNGTILFSTQGKGDVYQNILTVYSKQTANGLLPVMESPHEESYHLSGYISRPDQSRANRRYQIYFVNGRWIKSKIIDEALRLAYADKLFEGRYPVAFLFLEVPPEKLDVNIHPNKTELRFLDEDSVLSYLVSSLRQNLLAGNAAPNIMDHVKKLNSESLKTQDSRSDDMQVDIKYLSLNEERDRYDRILSDSLDFGYTDSQKAATKQENHERFLFSDLQILGNAFSSYILAQKEDSLYVIDQHAAHERVLYEQLMDNAICHKTDSQMMIEPWVVEIPFYLRELASDRLTLLNGLGYHIREFGPREYIVKEIPMCMDAGEAEAFLHDVLNSEPGSGRVEPELERKRLITQACKAAVKANDRLDVREIQSLLRALDGTENPFSCPHGRPTFLRFSQNDLEKMFLRK